MKRKERSKIANLPATAREQVDNWLFVDRLEHAAVRERLLKEFGCSVSLNSVSRYWQQGRSRRATDAFLDRIAAQAVRANQIVEEFERNPAAYHKVIANALGQRAMEHLQAEEVDDQAVIDIGYLLQGDQQIALKKQEAERKEKELTLAREKFQFDAAAACLKQLPALKLIASNPKLDDQAKLRAVREKLFGDLPE